MPQTPGPLEAARTSRWGGGLGSVEVASLPLPRCRRQPRKQVASAASPPEASQSWSGDTRALSLGPSTPTSAHLVVFLKGTFSLFSVTGRPGYLKWGVRRGKRKGHEVPGSDSSDPPAPSWLWYEIAGRQDLPRAGARPAGGQGCDSVTLVLLTLSRTQLHASRWLWDRTWVGAWAQPLDGGANLVHFTGFRWPRLGGL